MAQRSIISSPPFLYPIPRHHTLSIILVLKWGWKSSNSGDPFTPIPSPCSTKRYEEWNAWKRTRKYITFSDIFIQLFKRSMIYSNRINYNLKSCRYECRGRETIIHFFSCFYFVDVDVKLCAWIILKTFLFCLFWPTCYMNRRRHKCVFSELLTLVLKGPKTPVDTTIFQWNIKWWQMFDEICYIWYANCV